MKDLFETPELLPENVLEVLKPVIYEDADYALLACVKKQCEALGYTFDYYLDAIAINLVSVNSLINEKTGLKFFDDTDKHDFAKSIVFEYSKNQYIKVFYPTEFSSYFVIGVMNYSIEEEWTYLTNDAGTEEYTLNEVIDKIIDFKTVTGVKDVTVPRTTISIRKDLKGENCFVTLDEAQIQIDPNTEYQCISAQTEEGDKTLIYIADEWREVANIDFE